MIKKKKNDNPELNDVYGIPLANAEWTIGHICFIKETDGFLSVTVGFFGYRFNLFSELSSEVDSLDLSRPFTVISITGEPLRKKEWIKIGKRIEKYVNINLEERIKPPWGWMDNIERDTNWVLEMYFGIYPWDSFGDKDYMEKLLLPGQARPHFAKLRKDFSKEQLVEIGL